MAEGETFYSLAQRYYGDGAHFQLISRANRQDNDASDPLAPGTVLVTTQIDNRSLLLKPEMTGNAKILCGRHRIIDLVLRRLARTFEVEFWSWW